jgi:N-carbamoyl-L-amino-acid hydrolase
MARVAPTAMIFVPCADGISHNEIEAANADDLAAGCQVLLDAMIRRANAPA